MRHHIGRDLYSLLQIARCLVVNRADKPQQSTIFGRGFSLRLVQSKDRSRGFLDRFQRNDQFSHRLDTVLGTLCNHLLEDGVQRRWNIISFVAKRWDRLLTMRQQAFHGGAAIVHGTARKDAE